MARLGRAVPDLTVRHRRAELMDEPGLERARHLTALRALARVNRVSLAGARLWREVAAVQRRVGRPVRVLDLACGGGDVLAWVAARALRGGLPVELHGCDASPVAVEEARRVAGRAHAAGGPRYGEGCPPEAAPVDIFELDVLADDLPAGYDLITSSLFLHHLPRPEAVSLLRRMAERARAAVFVQDLRRTRLGYVLAWIGLHTLTRSDVARTDGLRSVRAAFTTGEAGELCSEAGLVGADVRNAWPQRFTVAWRKTGGSEGRERAVNDGARVDVGEKT